MSVRCKKLKPERERERGGREGGREGGGEGVPHVRSPNAGHTRHARARTRARPRARARVYVSARINAAIGAVGMSERSAWHERTGPPRRGVGRDTRGAVHLASRRTAKADDCRPGTARGRKRRSIPRATDTCFSTERGEMSTPRKRSASAAEPSATPKVARRERARRSIYDFRYR